MSHGFRWHLLLAPIAFLVAGCGVDPDGFMGPFNDKTSRIFLMDRGETSFRNGDYQAACSDFRRARALATGAEASRCDRRINECQIRFAEAEIARGEGYLREQRAVAAQQEFATALSRATAAGATDLAARARERDAAARRQIMADRIALGRTAIVNGTPWTAVDHLTAARAEGEASGADLTEVQRLLQQAQEKSTRSVRDPADPMSDLNSSGR